MQRRHKPRFAQRERPGISSIVGSIFFILIMVISIGALVTIFNSFTSYTQAVNKADNASLAQGETSLSFTSESFGSYPPSTLSNFNVATTTCSTTSTSTTNQGKIVYAAGMWWDFFACAAYDYSSSFDGTTWEAATALAGVPGGYPISGSALTVDVVGTTAYFAISDVGSNQFAFGIGTLASGGTVAAPAGTITFNAGNAIAAVTSPGGTNLGGPISIEVDGSGNTWVAASAAPTAPTLSHSSNPAAVTCNTTCTATFGASTVAVGDVIVLTLDWAASHAAPTSVADTRTTGNFALGVSETMTTGGVTYDSYIYYGTATSSGVDTITVTFGAPSVTAMISAFDVAGATGPGFTSSVGSATANGAGSTVTSFTPATNSFEIGTVEANVNTAVTPGAGFTISGGNGVCNKIAPNGCSEYEAGVSGAQTTPFSFGPMSGYSEAAIAFPPSTGGAIQVFEHEAACTAAQGWEPAACANGNPSNYAPAGITGSGITLQAPPTAITSTGVIMVYETGGSSSSTGTLTILTQGTLAAATTSWTTVTPTGMSDYAIASSSGVICGTSLCFAGLASSSLAQSSGTLNFWALAFTTLTSASSSVTETVIESGSNAWQGALTISGGTMVLFDNPTSSSIQYYISSSYGGKWSTSPITLVTGAGDTAIDGLSPALGAFGVTWANATPDVRAAALNTFVVSNNSPFAVHLVDMYVQKPATNTLVAHDYYNTTEEFDFWVGAGASVSLPVKFSWAATTSYLITVGADNGATAAVTATSLA